MLKQAGAAVEHRTLPVGHELSQSMLASREHGWRKTKRSRRVTELKSALPHVSWGAPQDDQLGPMHLCRREGVLSS
jgi:hypothetical protein